MKIFRPAWSFVTGIRYLTARDWAWAHFKVFIGVLLPIMALIQPPSVARTRELNPSLIHVLLIMMLFGGLLCIIAVFLRGTKVQPLIVGYTLELGGLIFLGFEFSC